MRVAPFAPFRRGPWRGIDDCNFVGLREVGLDDMQPMIRRARNEKCSSAKVWENAGKIDWLRPCWLGSVAWRSPNRWRNSKARQQRRQRGGDR